MPLFDEQPFCTKPFDELEIGWRGVSSVCCFVNRDVGTVNTSLDDVLNSRAAKAIRQSIVDGTFAFCDKDACPHLVGSSLAPRRVFRHSPYAQFISGASLDVDAVDVNISFDTSCNLRCVSCRSTENRMSWKEKQHAVRLMSVVEQSLHRIRKLHMCGSGDPLASGLLRDFLCSVNGSQYPHLAISLLTNGTLLDRRMWNEMRGIHSAITSIQVSVDAATQETYEKVRRNGSFARLVENMTFVSELRQAGEIDFFSISFVVSKMNYREMKAFVALGESLHCDQTYFSYIRNWGAMKPAAYEDLAVHAPGNPLHESLLEVLEDNVFDNERVFLGNLSALRPAI